MKLTLVVDEVPASCKSDVQGAERVNAGCVAKFDEAKPKIFHVRPHKVLYIAASVVRSSGLSLPP